MAKERLYGWNGELPAKAAGGQKAIVLAGLRAEPDTLRTGKEWAEIIGPELKTRQDPYRVVLYYILILKGDGCIRTNEFDIHAVTRNADVKHGIVVRTAATVEDRGTIEEPVEPTTDETAEELDTLGAS